MADAYCNACGLALANDTSGGPEEGVPCPACGSTSRRIDEYITLSVRPDMGLGMAAKRPGSKKPYVETYGGPKLSVKSGKFVHKVSVIDRDNDDYLEHIEDPETGEVLHHCHEPLSTHVGHGSAKHVVRAKNQS